MYNNETYEEYIRSVLGYPNYNNNIIENDYQNYPNNYRNEQEIEELENCYPEIYKIIYPRVSEACSMNTKPISQDLIDELTKEIYTAIENDNSINININLGNSVQNSQTPENRNSQNNNRRDVKIQENRGEDRQFRNRVLLDLIRILLIRELLERPGNRLPIRPPHRPPEGRPPYPGMPGYRTTDLDHFFINDSTNGDVVY